MTEQEKIEELINDEHTVKLRKPDGTIIEWYFVCDPDCSGYYAEQYVNGRYNKYNFLATDRPSAVRLWNSVFRHRRDLNKAKEGNE